jgi:cysteine-rich repeat protein
MLVSTCWNTVLKSNIINYAGNNGLRLFGGSGNTLSSNSICNSILYCFSNALSSNNNIFSGLNQCGDSSQTACPECGDGIQQGINEECDDGNRVSGDGCSSTCFNEKGSMYIWTGVPEGETINSQVFVDGVYNGSLGDSIDWPYIQIYALPGYHTIKVVIEGYETYINESVLVVTRQATEVEVKLIPKINRLAAYYTLDGNTDDTSGNGLNGVNNGAVLSQYAKSGQAYYFNGSTFIQAGSPTSLSDDITISFWVNPSSLSQNEAGMVYNGDNDGVGYGVMLKNDKLYVLYGALLWANGGYTIPKTNRWYNIVMVRDNAVLKLYVDGVRTSLNDLDGAIAPRVPTNSFFIGRSPISWEGNPRFFNGIIDEVKVYEGAMSDSEILAQYQSVDPNAGLIPGKCGSTVNICLVGDLQDINDDMINSNYLWNCIGDGGMDYCNISMMGSINAKTTPSGASLYIDGILNGVTPIIVKNVTKGSHGIRLFKSGYLSYNSIVTVNSGQETTINENLTVVPGSINAKSTPSGARVYLNGTLKGVTNTTITDVAPGSYLVKMSKQDYKSYEKNITITSGQVTIVSSILTILPGLINATSNPTGATVYLDNVYKGTTPKNITGISPGNHTLKFTKTDYFNYTTSVDVFAGTAKNLDVTLSYSLGGIHVTSTFSGANISVDGVYKGTTPKNITGLTQGNHTVKFAKYGYYGSTMVIGVIASNNQSVLGTLIAMPNGTIEAISDPKGASIYIDGYPKSSTNRNVTGIPVGSRTVKLVKTGYQNYTSVVDVYQNQRTTVNVNLIPV